MIRKLVVVQRKQCAVINWFSLLFLFCLAAIKAYWWPSTHICLDGCYGVCCFMGMRCSVSSTSSTNKTARIVLRGQNWKGKKLFNYCNSRYYSLPFFLLQEYHFSQNPRCLGRGRNAVKYSHRQAMGGASDCHRCYDDLRRGTIDSNGSASQEHYRC